MTDEQEARLRLGEERVCNIVMAETKELIRDDIHDDWYCGGSRTRYYAPVLRLVKDHCMHKVTTYAPYGTQGWTFTCWQHGTVCYSDTIEAENGLRKTWETTLSY